MFNNDKVPFSLFSWQIIPTVLQLITFESPLLSQNNRFVHPVEEKSYCRFCTCFVKCGTQFSFDYNFRYVRCSRILLMEEVGMLLGRSVSIISFNSRAVTEYLARIHNIFTVSFCYFSASRCKSVVY